MVVVDGCCDWGVVIGIGCVGVFVVWYGNGVCVVCIGVGDILVGEYGCGVGGVCVG